MLQRTQVSSVIYLFIYSFNIPYPESYHEEYTRFRLYFRVRANHSDVNWQDQIYKYTHTIRQRIALGNAKSKEINWRIRSTAAWNPRRPSHGNERLQFSHKRLLFRGWSLGVKKKGVNYTKAVWLTAWHIKWKSRVGGERKEDATEMTK